MRIMSNQPQVHFTRRKPVIVKPDTTVHGKQIGEGYEFRQGDDYMILHHNGLQEAIFLARMGYEVELQ